MDQDRVIPLSEAAAISGVSLKHLGLLAGKGKLGAEKMERNWVTTREAVAKYLSDSFKTSKDPYKYSFNSSLGIRASGTQRVLIPGSTDGPNL